MIYQVVIDDDAMNALFFDVAERNGVSALEYVTNIVRGWADSQLRGAYHEYVRTCTLDELTNNVVPFAVIKTKVKP